MFVVLEFVPQILPLSEIQRIISLYVTLLILIEDLISFDSYLCTTECVLASSAGDGAEGSLLHAAIIFS